MGFFEREMRCFVWQIAPLFGPRCAQRSKVIAYVSLRGCAQLCQCRNLHGLRGVTVGYRSELYPLGRVHGLLVLGTPSTKDADYVTNPTAALFFYVVSAFCRHVHCVCIIYLLHKLCVCACGGNRGELAYRDTERVVWGWECLSSSLSVCLCCLSMFTFSCSVCRLMCVVPSAYQSICPSVSVDNYSHNNSLMLLCESVKTAERNCPDVVKTHVINKGLKYFLMIFV